MSQRVEMCGVARGECSPFQVFDVSFFLGVELIMEEETLLAIFFSWCAYGCVPKPSYTSRNVESAC